METEIIIIDNNELSLLGYAEEYPEHWKEIYKSLEKDGERAK